MKFWRAFVPNLCISLWLALLTLVILDSFNPIGQVTCILLYQHFCPEATNY